MNRKAASSFSSPSKPAMATPIPLSYMSRSHTPNVSSRSFFEANHRYSVGLDTRACSATSDRLSFVIPLRLSTSAVAVRMRCRVDESPAAGSVDLVVVCATPVALQIIVEVSRCFGVEVRLRARRCRC